jgi:SAM-dependent methyltransferase
MTSRRLFTASLVSIALAQALPASAQTKPPAFEPQVGQAGKDVIWVPTQPYTVTRMLKMAQVTPKDFVIDLGSGDGRIAIAAAKEFKTRALGIEYNPDMVEFSKREATKAGVTSMVEFRKADIFESDFSQATVITMYLLPQLNLQLRPKLLDMKPGTRLVSHQFTMDDWQPDETSTINGRDAHLWIVPAKVAGDWSMRVEGATATAKPAAEFKLGLRQQFQKLSGEWNDKDGRHGLRDPFLSANRISFGILDDAGTMWRFEGTVEGERMSGRATHAGKTMNFSAERTKAL